MPRTQQEIEKANEAKKEEARKYLANDKGMRQFLANKGLNPEQADRMNKAIMSALDESTTDRLIKNPYKAAGSQIKSMNESYDFCVGLMRNAHRRAMLKALKINYNIPGALFDLVFYGNAAYGKMLEVAREFERNEQAIIDKDTRHPGRQNAYTKEVIPALPLLYLAIIQDKERFPEESREQAKSMLKNFQMPPIENPEGVREQLKAMGMPVREPGDQNFLKLRQQVTEKMQQHWLDEAFSPESASAGRWEKRLLAKPGMSPEERAQIIKDIKDDNRQALQKRYFEELRSFPIQDFKNLNMDYCLKNYEEMTYYALLAYDAGYMYDGMLDKDRAMFSKEDMELYKSLKTDVTTLANSFLGMVNAIANPLSDILAFEKLEKENQIFAIAEKLPELQPHITAGIAHYVSSKEQAVKDAPRVENVLAKFNEKYPPDEKKVRIDNLLRQNQVQKFLQANGLDDEKKKREIKAAFDDSLTDNMVQKPVAEQLGKAGDNYDRLCEELKHAHFRKVYRTLGINMDDLAFDAVFYGNGSYDDMLKVAKKNEATRNKEIEHRTRKAGGRPVRMTNEYTEKIIPALPLLYEAMRIDRERYSEKNPVDAKRMLENYDRQNQVDTADMKKKIQAAGLPVRELDEAGSRKYQELRGKIRENLQNKSIERDFSGELGKSFRWAKKLLEKPGLSDENRRQILKEIDSSNEAALQRRFIQELSTFPFDLYKNLNMDNLLNHYDEMAYYANLAFDSETALKNIHPDVQKELGKEKTDQVRTLQQNVVTVGGYFDSLINTLAEPFAEVVPIETIGMDQIDTLIKVVPESKAIPSILYAYVISRDTYQSNLEMAEKAQSALNGAAAPKKEVQNEIIDEEEGENINVIHEDNRPINRNVIYEDDRPINRNVISEDNRNVINEDNRKPVQEAVHKDILTRLKEDKQIDTSLKKKIRAGLKVDLEKIVKNPEGAGTHINVVNLVEDAGVSLKYAHFYAMVDALGLNGNPDWGARATYDKVMFKPQLGDEMPEEMRDLVKGMPEDLKPAAPYLYEAIRRDHDEFAANEERARRMLGNLKLGAVDSNLKKELRSMGFKPLTGQAAAKNLQKVKKYRNVYSAQQAHEMFAGEKGDRWKDALLRNPGLSKEERSEIVREIKSGDDKKVGERYLRALRNIPIDKISKLTFESYVDNYPEMMYYRDLVSDIEFALQNTNAFGSALSDEERKLYKEYKDQLQPKMVGYDMQLAVNMYPAAEVVDVDSIGLEKVVDAIDSGKAHKTQFFFNDMATVAGSKGMAVELDPAKCKNILKRLDEIEVAKKDAEKEIKEDVQQEKPENQAKQEAEQKVEPQPQQKVKAEQKAEPEAANQLQPSGRVLAQLAADGNLSNEQKAQIEAGLKKNLQEMVDHPLAEENKKGAARHTALDRAVRDLAGKLRHAHLEAVLDGMKLGADNKWGQASAFDGIFFMEKLPEVMPQEMEKLVDGMPEDLKKFAPYIYEAIRLDHDEYGANRERAKQMFGNIELGKVDQKLESELKELGIPLITDPKKLAENQAKVNQYREIYFDHVARNAFSGQTGARWKGVLLHKPGMTKEEHDEIVREMENGEEEKLAGRYLKEFQSIPLEKVQKLTNDEYIKNHDEMEYYAELAFNMDHLLRSLNPEKTDLVAGEKEQLYHDLKNALQTKLESFSQRLTAYIYPVSAIIDVDKLTFEQKKKIGNSKSGAQPFGTLLLITDMAVVDAEKDFSVDKCKDILKQIDQADAKPGKAEAPEDEKIEKIEKIDQEGAAQEIPEPVENDRILFENPENRGGMREDNEPDSVKDVRNYPASSAIGRMRPEDAGELPSEQCREGLADMFAGDADLGAYSALKGKLRDENKPLTKADWKKLSLSLAALEKRYKPTEKLSNEEQGLEFNEKQKLIGIKNILRADRNILERIGGQLSERIEGHPVKPMPFALHVVEAKKYLLEHNPRLGANDRDAAFRTSLETEENNLQKEQVKESLRKADLNAWLLAQNAARAMDKIELMKTLPGVNWFDSDEFTNMQKALYDIAKNRPNTYADMEKAITHLHYAAEMYLDAKGAQRGKSTAYSESGKRRQKFAEEIYSLTGKCMREFKAAKPADNAAQNLKDTAATEMSEPRRHNVDPKLDYSEVFAARAQAENALGKKLNEETATAYARYIVLDDVLENGHEEEISRITMGELERRVFTVKNSPAMQFMIGQGKRLCSDLVEFNKCNAVLKKIDAEEQRLYEMNFADLTNAAAKGMDKNTLKEFKTGISKVDKVLDVKGLAQKVLTEKTGALKKTYAQEDLRTFKTNRDRCVTFVKGEDLKEGNPQPVLTQAEFKMMKNLIMMEAAEHGASESRAKAMFDNQKDAILELSKAQHTPDEVRNFVAGGIVDRVKAMKNPEQENFIQNFVQNAPKKEPVIKVRQIGKA